MQRWSATALQDYRRMTHVVVLEVVLDLGRGRPPRRANLAMGLRGVRERGAPGCLRIDLALLVTRRWLGALEIWILCRSADLGQGIPMRLAGELYMRRKTTETENLCSDTNVRSVLGNLGVLMADDFCLLCVLVWVDYRPIYSASICHLRPKM
uniref:Putative transcriptional regulatory protein NarL n=1 Tax=Anthurium amnicola TaxID=1678845 RepID=A0A1D1Y9U0_9ARAE